MQKREEITGMKPQGERGDIIEGDATHQLLNRVAGKRLAAWASWKTWLTARTHNWGRQKSAMQANLSWLKKRQVQGRDRQRTGREAKGG